MSKHFFCRELCLRRHEPLAGTGQVAQRSLLLHWPRGKWRVPRHASAGMSPRLSVALEAAMKAGLHVALVDHPDDGTDIPLLQLQPEGISMSCHSEADLVDAIDSYVAGDLLEGTAEPRVTILCCTDSRRDACCARFGFATYKALREYADPARFQLLQCTHAGGCRFAASLIVLPQRQRYGRLSPEEASAFLDAVGKQEIYLPAYRGRTDTPEPLQVAEITALEWADRNGMDRSLVQLGTSCPSGIATPGDSLTLTVHANDIRLAIDLIAEEYTVQLRCSAVVTGESSQSIRWRAVAITPQLTSPDRVPLTRKAKEQTS